MAKRIRSLTPEARRAKELSNLGAKTNLPAGTKTGARSKAEEARRAKRREENAGHNVTTLRAQRSEKEIETVREPKVKLPSQLILSRKTPRQIKKTPSPKAFAGITSADCQAGRAKKAVSP